MKNPDNDSFDSKELIKTVVRSAGLIALLIGLVLTCDIFSRAWKLLEEPKLISTLSTEIDRQSNLGAFSNDMYSFLKQSSRAANVSQHQAPASKVTVTADRSEVVETTAAPVSTSGVESTPALNLSYFVAWIFVLIVLKICVSLAMSALKYGTDLALHDRDEKSLRALLKESLGSLKSAGK